MLALHAVTVRYGDTLALDRVDLEVPRGRTVALVGPSGCGKSTALRVLAGLVDPTAGEARVAGEPLARATIEALRRRIGYVIQEGGLFPHLTAGDNATLVARHLGWSRARTAERAAELCELLRVEPEWLERYPRELSGGQRQRVALLRALFLDPEALLLDEPLGALDPEVRAELQRELRELFRRLGKSVLLVTHDLAEAGFLGDELALLRDGRVVQQGPLSDLVQRPADEGVERFVGAQRSLAEVLR